MTEEPTLRVKDWRRFQHYTGRRPPWIKLHRDLLDNYDYSRLPLASRALAPCLWLLASESEDGSIRANVPWLAFRLHCQEAELRVALKGLIDHGFLECSQDASNALAGCVRDACLETETEIENRNGLVEPAPPAPRTALTKPVSLVARKAWSHEAAEDWIAAYDGQPTGAFFKALESLVKRETWAVVRPVLRYYLAATVPEYVNVPKFVAQFGSWQARQQGRQPSTAQMNDKAAKHRRRAETFIRAGLVGDGSVDMATLEGSGEGSSLDSGHGAVAGLLQGPRDGRGPGNRAS